MIVYKIWHNMAYTESNASFQSLCLLGQFLSSESQTLLSWLQSSGIVRSCHPS